MKKSTTKTPGSASAPRYSPRPARLPQLPQAEASPSPSPSPSINPDSPTGHGGADLATSATALPVTDLKAQGFRQSGGVVQFE